MKKKPTTPTSPEAETTRQGGCIKLGVDVHIEKYVAVMKVDSSAPCRAKVFRRREALLAWVGQLADRCGRLCRCYEAGPFGYALHRELEAMVVTNYMIRPINWDEHGKRVKTDARDAAAMARCLDGCLRGNTRSFSVVRVPSEAEERLHSVTRQCQSLCKERRRLSAKGRSHVMYYGGRLAGEWWKPRRWKSLQDVLALLAPLRALILAIDEQVAEVEKAMRAMGSPELARGMGFVIFQQMEREVGDWGRFGSTRPVGSYTGL